MRVAIPVWEERISPVLDTALRLLVVEIGENRKESRSYFPIDDQALTQKCNSIRKLKLDTLICGAVSHVFLQMLAGSGLNVVKNISGPAEEVLSAYMEGNIFQPRYMMPGCRNNCNGCGKKNRRITYQRGKPNV